MKCEIDIRYLHELLCRYDSLNEITKEKINVRNGIMEILIPVVKSILLTYETPLNFDLFQDAMVHLMNLIEKWNPLKTNDKKKGVNDLGFFICGTHNFCKNYLKKKSTRHRREVLVDPIEQPFWESLPNWELPREIHITKTCQLEDKNLQKAYEHCLDILLGNSDNRGEKVNLTEEIRDKFKLTYENTKLALIMAENAIREGINNG